MTYYQILQVNSDAGAEEIKSAFRRLAKECHPDRNNNSEESRLKFIIVSNAYRVLSSKREEYDSFLAESSLMKSSSGSVSGSGQADAMITGKGAVSSQEITDYLNWLLWDIADFIGDNGRFYRLSKNSRESAEKLILKLLAFIDKWILVPSGNGDYFMTARKMEENDPEVLAADFSYGRTASLHKPYFTLHAYFYDIRRRSDRFVSSLKTEDLFKEIKNGKHLRLIDSLLEAHNYGVHVLSLVMQEEVRDPEISAYEFSSEEFMHG